MWSFWLVTYLLWEIPQHLEWRREWISLPETESWNDYRDYIAYWIDWVTFLLFLFLMLAPLIFPSHVIIFWTDVFLAVGPFFPPWLIVIVVCTVSSSDESLLETFSVCGTWGQRYLKNFSRCSLNHIYIFLCWFAFDVWWNCWFLRWSFTTLLITCHDIYLFFSLERELLFFGLYVMCCFLPFQACCAFPPYDALESSNVDMPYCTRCKIPLQ